MGKAEIRSSKSQAQGRERGKQLVEIGLGVGGGDGEAQTSVAARDGGVADRGDEDAPVAERGGSSNGLAFIANQKGKDGAAESRGARGSLDPWHLRVRSAGMLPA